MAFKNRIVKYGKAKVDEILFNPKNWRVHPKIQQEALKGVLEEIGWVQDVTINMTTGNLVDGHLRVQLAGREGEKVVPARYIELTQEEEDIILASLDPIAAMAETDKLKLEAIIKAIHSNTESIQNMLDQIIADNKLFKDTEDDGVNLELLKLSLGEPEHRVNPGEVYKVGRHWLVCASPINEVHLWYGFLAPEMWFCPYPNPMTLLGKYEMGILAVTPSIYLCGHILDRWAEVHGEDSIEKR